MTRMGCQPGDSVFVTRLMGLGNALGLARLNAHPGILFPEKLFRPVANLRESMLIRNHATCCMDTSDGLLATLDQLMRINNLGFAIECDWKRILVPEAIELCRQAGIPLWTMAAGPHGEFALLFTIPRKRQESFLREASSCAFDPIYLGRVKEEPALTLKRHDASWVDVDMCYLRNLLYLANGDFKRYIREFLEYGIKAGLE
jgi:thiamine-monophosphate kinase